MGKHTTILKDVSEEIKILAISLGMEHMEFIAIILSTNSMLYLY
jgi:hypothetical protein